MKLSLGKTIGKGGQSEVVRATMDGQEYAVKLFPDNSVFEKELEVLKETNNSSCLPNFHCVTKVRDK